MSTIEGVSMPHIMEIMGKTRVVVKDGEVVEVGEVELEWCPLIEKLSGVQKITSEEVKKNVESKIRDYGMFTTKRQLLGHDTFVAFRAAIVTRCFSNAPTAVIAVASLQIL